MFFSNVTGQESIIRQLITDAQRGTVPHALLFYGPEGTGKLLTALAYARYLLCGRHTEEDSCGTCPSCVKMNKLIHPDLHFVFPVVNRKRADNPTISDDEIVRWREFLLEHDYFGYEEWLDALGAENRQAAICTAESDSISDKLKLTSSQGGYKIMIIWLPEKMHPNCANKLLKLLEEPPSQTVFILVSDQPDNILGTIVSRTRKVEFRPLPAETIASRLEGPGYMLDHSHAAKIAHVSSGSWLKALQAMRIDQHHQEYLDIFKQMMRLAYARKLKELKTLSEDIAAKGREWDKDYLEYCQNMVRENFVYNLHREELVYLSDDEAEFSARFSPFVNEKNIEGITFELAECQTHIERNVNAKIVMMDFMLKLIILLKQ